MKLRLSVAIAFVAATVLVACGGGGGGSSIPPSTSTPLPSSTPTTQPTTQATTVPTAVSSSTPKPVNTPTPSATPTPKYSPATNNPFSPEIDAGQASQSEQGLFVASITQTLGAVEAAGNGASLGLSFPSLLTQIRSLPVRIFSSTSRSRRFETGNSIGPCANLEQTTTQAETGFTTLSVRGYPDGDTTCSGEPEFQLSLNFYTASGQITCTPCTADGAAYWYSVTNGVQTEVAESEINYLSVSSNGTNFTVEGTFSTANGLVSSTYGATCSSAGCGAGAAVNVALDFPGVNLNTSVGALQQTVAGGATGLTAYVAPVNSGMSLGQLPSNAFPFFNITGPAGMTTDTLSITPTPGGYNVIDAANAAEVEVTTPAQGHVGPTTGVVLDTTTNTQMATFTMDQFGNGSLTLTSPAEQLPIAGFLVY